MGRIDKSPTTTYVYTLPTRWRSISTHSLSVLCVWRLPSQKWNIQKDGEKRVALQWEKLKHDLNQVIKVSMNSDKPGW